MDLAEYRRRQHERHLLAQLDMGDTWNLLDQAVERIEHLEAENNKLSLQIVKAKRKPRQVAVEVREREQARRRSKNQ